MIYSTLEGRTPGRAFVDTAERPARCLLVINFLHFAFAGGAPDAPWLAQTIGELRQEQDLYLNRSAGQALNFAPSALPDRVQGGLEFLDCRLAPVMPVPSGHQLRLVDRNLFAGCMWHDAMIAVFGTAENFLRHGIGLCLTEGEEICSEAYAAWRGAGRFEIGIVTAEPRRGRGYAFMACQHLIRLCEAAGQPTCWSCFADNLASAAVARKLGYQTERADEWLYYART
jgi:hypothetical protein